MNINENQEFEAINSKIKERSVNVEEVRQSAAETYREVKARRKAKSLASIFAAVVMFAVAVVVCYGLESIGWINSTFQIVLMCISGAVSMFKIGLRWNELKQ